MTDHDVVMGADRPGSHQVDDGRPGDRYAMDADLTLYWPRVRPCWEERDVSPGGETLTT